jgi:hypothetical protein
MIELLAYLSAVGYNVSKNDNGTIIIRAVTSSEILTLIKGINFQTECKVEAVVVDTLTYELRAK